MTKFTFKNFEFDYSQSIAKFHYEFDNGYGFAEEVRFQSGFDCDHELMRRALFLAFILIGTSYYKAFPEPVVNMSFDIDEWQTKFFNTVYQEGLSQFAFENELRREDLAHFKVTSPISEKPVAYDGKGILALQSGGKDSLLLTTLLSEKGLNFTPWFVSSSDKYPEILDELGQAPAICTRLIDFENLKKAAENGAKNGHVPITYIIQSLAVIQAILLGKNQIVTSIGQEGVEPHTKIGDLPVMHQWSKTWAAEKEFSEYVTRYISPDIKIGSPLRQFSELRVAELFVKHSWKKFGQEFSSCNIANYRQGNDNSKLSWCTECPKCANSYLLFAPFVPSAELKNIFSGKDLFLDHALEFTFKGLLGIDSIPKPFECVGETGELRLAYKMAMKKDGFSKLPFDVPDSTFDYTQTYPVQEWAEKMI